MDDCYQTRLWIYLYADEGRHLGILGQIEVAQRQEEC